MEIKFHNAIEYYNHNNTTQTREKIKVDFRKKEKTQFKNDISSENSTMVWNRARDIRTKSKCIYTFMYIYTVTDVGLKIVSDICSINLLL